MTEDSLSRSATLFFNQEFARLERSLPQNPRIEYVIYPQLEDNLSTAGWARARMSYKRRFKGRQDCTIGRNPNHLVGHFQPSEAHTYDSSILKYLKVGDTVTGDGDILCFPGEKCKGHSVGDVLGLIKKAHEKGVSVLVYRPETQGLPVGGGDKPTLTPPSKRHYRILRPDLLIQLMKG